MTTAPADPQERPRATGTSLAAVVLAFVCFAAVTALHWLRSDLDPLQRVMSEYANGTHGLVMTVAFYAFGLACLALAFRLRRAVDRRGAVRAVPALLAVSGAGLLLSGAFEVGYSFLPDTMEESVHSAASITAFVALIMGMLLFSFATQRDERWRSFGVVSWVLSLSAASAAAASPLLDGSTWSGGLQRLLGGAVLLWVLATARRIRTNAFRGTQAA